MGQCRSVLGRTVYSDKTRNANHTYRRRANYQDSDSEGFLATSAAKILRDNRNARRIAEGVEPPPRRQPVVITNNHTTPTPHCLMNLIRDDGSDDPDPPPEINRRDCGSGSDARCSENENEENRGSSDVRGNHDGGGEMEERKSRNMNLRDSSGGSGVHSEENELNSLNTRLCSFSSDNDEDDEDDEGDEDTFASRIDLEKINSIKSKQSSFSNKRNRKESFEQRLKRTFTIKDEHTSEVTKRIVALVIKYALFVFNFLSWVMATGTIVSGIWTRTDKTVIVTTSDTNFFLDPPVVMCIDGGHIDVMATGTIVSGIWMRTDQTVIVTTSDTNFFLDPPVVMCIGGGITFIVAFLGCVGALRENLILLKVFFYVLTFILLGEIVIGCGVFVIYIVPEARENFLRSQPEQILRSAVQKYMDDPDIKSWLDGIQSEFECCGVSHTDEGFRDWKDNKYFNCTPSNKSIYRCAVPTSCCIFKKGDRVNTMCGFDTTNKPLIEVRDYIHTRGCIHGFGEWLGKYDDLIIISCLTILIMQGYLCIHGIGEWLGKYDDLIIILCLTILIMQTLAVLSAKLMVIRITKQRSRWQVLLRSSTGSTSSTTAVRSSL